MSQNYPPPGGYPNEPLNYNYGAPAASARPTAVTVLAVFAIVLASLGILSDLCGGGFHIANQAAGGLKVGPTRVPAASFASGAVQIGTAVIYLILNVVILIAAIGLLKLKPWARRTTLTLSWLQIGLMIVWAIATLVWVIPDSERINAETMAANGGATTVPTGVTQTMSSAQTIGMYLGVVLGAALAITLPIFNLIFLPKPRIKAAFGESAV